MIPTPSQTQLNAVGWVCGDCGARYGRRIPNGATWHYATCGVCKEHKPVTEPRDFGGLRVKP